MEPRLLLRGCRSTRRNGPRWRRANTPDNSTAHKVTANRDRLPPHSPEAETGVLGCILAGGATCVADAINAGVGVGDFYDLRHRSIWEAAVSLFDQNKGVDAVTLCTELKRQGLLETAGGIAYIGPLEDGVPSTENLPYYISDLKEASLRRQLVDACASTTTSCYEPSRSSKELVEDHEREILKLLGGNGSGPQMRPMKENVVAAISKIEEIHTKGGGTFGLSTGFADLDQMTCGLQATDLSIIAGRPSTGKTSLAMQIAEHVALTLKEPVGVFSLEMSDVSLTMRMLCSIARINMQRMRQGVLCMSDFTSLTAAASKLANAPLYIDQSSCISISQLRAKARRMVQLYKIKLLIIDYLQLLHAKAESRQTEVAAISAGCKELAKDLNIPVLALSQMNRDQEKGVKGQPRPPRLSDLRESGAIEQDADFVGLLWRPTPDTTELLVAKQRNGPTGPVPLVFIKEYTRFENAAKIEPEDEE
jgi:replicative DNA helicase